MDGTTALERGPGPGQEGRARVADGHDRAHGTITVFGPWRPTGGTRMLSANGLASALQPAGGTHSVERY